MSDHFTDTEQSDLESYSSDSIIDYLNSDLSYYESDDELHLNFRKNILWERMDLNGHVDHQTKEIESHQ